MTRRRRPPSKTLRLEATQQVESAKKAALSRRRSCRWLRQSCHQTFAAVAGVPSNPSAAIPGHAEHASSHVLRLARGWYCHHSYSSQGLGSAVERLTAVYEVTAKIIEIIMKFAPYAVACLLSTIPPASTRSLAGFGLVCGHRPAGSIAAHVRRLFAVHLFPSRMSPLEFFKRIKPLS